MTELPASPVAWHALEPDDALTRLDTSPAGLTPQQAAARLARLGPNEVRPPRGPGVLRVLLRQFQSPIVYLLLVAAAAAAALGKGLDALVVAGAIVVNVVIGFVQEFRAGKAVQALSRMVPLEATVLRGGHKLAVPAASLVPGDVVLLAPGDKVPADLRVLEARGVAAEEAALTGESVPVAKTARAVDAAAALGDRTSILHSGTLVTSGYATGLVVATGLATELGHISRMLAGIVEVQTPLTRALAKLGTSVTAAIVGVSAVIFGVSLARGFGAVDGLLAAVALAVALIPEGLPAILTITMAVGVQRMAARRAIVRTLPAVETLGSTTVICTDKTGTLTCNQMTVQALWTPAGPLEVTGVGYAPQGRLRRHQQDLDALAPDVEALLRAGALCNGASVYPEDGGWHISGDPTEAALVVAAEKAHLPVSLLRQQWPRVDVIPFDSDQQFMATLHRDPAGGARILLKGAPEVVLARCTGDVAAAQDAVLGFTRQGLRVLAVAEKPAPPGTTALAAGDVAQGFAFLGLEGMRDPPRPEALAAVRACHAAGITVKMISGDHRGTAEALGVHLGLQAAGAPVLEGVQVGRMDDAALAQAVRETNVFARAGPEHKLRLVKALQQQHQVVAMTGDGVNDAPALKQADIGMAMGITGTAVSREASDVVLADDNFATIAAAVEEGRRIYDNLIKSLVFVLPTNLGMGFVLLAAVLLFPLEVVDGVRIPLLPIRPTQLLWVNLVSAVALSLPLAFEVAEPDLMGRPPRPADAPVLGTFVLLRTLLAAAVLSGGALALFLWEYRGESGHAGHAQALREAQTMAVTTIVFFQVFYLVNCRSLRGTVRDVGLFTNRTVYVGIGALLALHAAFVYAPAMNAVFGSAPLSLRAVARSALVGAVILPIITLEKWLRARRDLPPAAVTWPGGAPEPRPPQGRREEHGIHPTPHAGT